MAGTTGLKYSTNSRNRKIRMKNTIKT